jgi:hypothetical protein
MQVKYQDLYVGGIIRFIPKNMFRTVTYYIITQINSKDFIPVTQIESADPNYQVTSGISIRPNLEIHKSELYKMDWIEPENYHELMGIIFDPRCKAYNE